MDERKKKFNENFYVFLRNAQPLAFLASFSMVLAVFAFPNTAFASVYSNAAIASTMFIVSFVCGLLSQFLIVREEEEGYKEPYSLFELIRYGTYFFLAVGVIYLLLIAVEFGKSLPPIFNTVAAWSWLFTAALTAGIAKQTLKSIIKKEQKPKFIALFVICISLCYSVTGFIIGFNWLLSSFIKFQLDVAYLTYFNIVIVGIFAGVIFIWSRIIIRKRNKSTS